MMPKGDGVPYEELLRRFGDKMAMIPTELRTFVPVYIAYRAIQNQRKAWGNRVVAATRDDSKVFWAHAMDQGQKAILAESSFDVTDGFVRAERKIQKHLEAIKQTEWWSEVVQPAAEGYIGTNTACGLLYHIGSALRFSTPAKLWVYCGLDVRGGYAPSTIRNNPERITPEGRQAIVEWDEQHGDGAHLRYNTPVLALLYELAETWNKRSIPVRDENGNYVTAEVDGRVKRVYQLDPECVWRSRWDRLKREEMDRRPGEKPWFYHNKARRKVLRKFIGDLWRLWGEWESGRANHVA